MNASATITLALPIAVTRSGGKVETTPTLTVVRPKTRHIKTLVLLLGVELIELLMAEGPEGSNPDQVRLKELGKNAIPMLLNPQKLDDFMALVADLAGISADEAGELDPADFVAVLFAVIGFFPALQSIASSSSAQT